MRSRVYVVKHSEPVIGAEPKFPFGLKDDLLFLKVFYLELMGLRQESPLPGTPGRPVSVSNASRIFGWALSPFI